MTAASPYRARPAPVSTMSLAAVALPRALWIVFLVLVGAPILLHVFLWSRVVTVRCERDRPQQIWCDVDEVAITGSDHARVEATGAARAVAVGAVHRSRGGQRPTAGPRTGSTWRSIPPATCTWRASRQPRSSSGRRGSANTLREPGGRMSGAPRRAATKRTGRRDPDSAVAGPPPRVYAAR
jgi:hypothetical protein